MDSLLSMFEGLNCSSRDDLANNFCRILQCEKKVAEFFLDSASWNVERALNAYLSSVGNKDMLLTSFTPPPKALFDETSGLKSGSEFSVNQVVPVQFRFLNNGVANWPSGCYFTLAEGCNFGIQTTQVPAVPKGGVCKLNIAVRMPPRAGTYAGSFRLVYGTKRVSRDLWVVANVTAPPGYQPPPAETVSLADEDDDDDSEDSFGDDDEEDEDDGAQGFGDRMPDSWAASAASAQNQGSWGSETATSNSGFSGDSDWGGDSYWPGTGSMPSSTALPGPTTESSAFDDSDDDL